MLQISRGMKWVRILVVGMMMAGAGYSSLSQAEVSPTLDPPKDLTKKKLKGTSSPPATAPSTNKPNSNQPAAANKTAKSNRAKRQQRRATHRRA